MSRRWRPRLVVWAAARQRRLSRPLHGDDGVIGRDRLGGEFHGYRPLSSLWPGCGLVNGADDLPPVDVEGVPLGADCVARTDAGLCGDRMVALRYERMLDLAGLDAIRGWADSRGFGLLPYNTWLQAPVAPEELQLLGIPHYTFGWGGAVSAVNPSAGKWCRGNSRAVMNSWGKER